MEDFKFSIDFFVNLLKLKQKNKKLMSDKQLIDIMSNISSKPTMESTMEFFLYLVNFNAEEEKAIRYFIDSKYDVNEKVSETAQNIEKRGFALNTYRKHKKSALKKIKLCWEEMLVFKFIKENPHYNE